MAFGMTAFVFPEEDTENVFYIGATAEGTPILKWWRFTRGSGVPWKNIGIGYGLNPPARPAAKGSDVTGYINADDHTMHVVYISDYFEVIDLQRNANSFEWTWVSLAPQAWNGVDPSGSPRSYSPLTSWTLTNGREQHVVFKANDGWAYEAIHIPTTIWFGPPRWLPLVQLWQDEQTAGDGMFYYPAMTSYVWQASNTEHLIFTGIGDGVPNNVWELWQPLDGGGWQQTSFNNAEDNNPNPQLAPGSGLAGYETPEDQTEHFILIAGSDVWEMFRSTSSQDWANNVLTDPSITTGGPPQAYPGYSSEVSLDPPISPVAAYYWPQEPISTEHVIYVGRDRKIYEIYKRVGPPPWSVSDLSSPHTVYGYPAKLPLWKPGTGIAGYVWPEDKSEHVIFVGDDDNVHELYYVAVEGQDHWWHNELGSY